MSTIQEFVDFVNRQDVGYVSNFVLVARQVDIELKIVVVSYQLEHGVVNLLLLHEAPDHVRVNKLVHFFDGHIHAMVGRNVPLEL